MVASPRRDSSGPLQPASASERTQELVDEEVRRLVGTAYGEVAELLRTHRDRLDVLAQALIERETLDESDAYGVVGIDAPRVFEESAP